MTLRNTGFAGAGLLIAGLFTPIVSMPIVGNVNLFNNGSNWPALILALLAAFGAVLIIKERLADVIWPGAGAAAILLYLFGRLQYGLSEMREAVAVQLQDNPFAGIAQAALGSIQLQWGWLILAAGAGLLIYVGAKARNEAGATLTAMNDGMSRLAAGLSALALIAVVALDLLGRESTAASPVADSAADESLVTNDVAAVTDAADGPTGEEAAYIRQNLRLYDLDAKYFDSILNGRVPGVTFKIQNNGERTLNEVTVRVVFYDEQERAIAEEEYTPVLASEYNFGGDNTPLRPNYIWQQESDKFFVANNVPSEWATGKARATITDVEFGPSE